MHHRFIVSRHIRNALGAKLAALAFTCGCSLQDFSYLQKGAGGSNDGTGGGSNGGATVAAGGSANGGEQSGGTTNAGGTSPTGAVGGTATSNGGTPSGSSRGGSPASGGSSTAGGTSSAGGAMNTSATTSLGGTSSTGGATSAGGATSTGGLTSTGGASGLSTAGVVAITNAGFETGASNIAPFGWTLSGTSPTASYILYDQANAHSGFGCLNNWSASAYSVTTSQDVALPNGDYTLSIWYFGSAYAKQFVFARGYDSANLAAELHANTVPTAAYVELTISPISVTSGKVTIGVYSEGAAGAWSHFDDVTLTQIP